MTTTLEHEVLTFQRVQGALNGIIKGITVKSTGPLAEALGQLGCFPYVKVPCDSFDLNCELLIAGKPAGTFEKPDVNVILQESTASSFGRGETTVLDPTYRNGKEIPAQNIDITEQAYRYFSRTSEDEISAAMFVGKTVKLKLYKLAVYEEGGHFDWHMDSTHSDRHHATLLLALNTSWEGGDLKLRRKGVETLVDMHPKANRRGEGVNLQAAAFYTDTEHKVEPVTKGIRIILQFDVEVVGWGEKSTLAVKEKGTDEDEEDKEEDEEDEDDTTKGELFYNMENISRKRKRYQKTEDPVTADDAIVAKVTKIIASLLLADAQEEVAFAMQHLYRMSSILPEFLKGADAQLYHALVGDFDVTLRPVVLQSLSDYEGYPESCLAIPWDQGKTDPDTKSDSDLESDNKSENDGGGSEDDENAGSEDDGSEDDESRIRSETKSQPKDMTFHLPMLSAIEQISYQSYIEYTGNSAQRGETKYFGGGMFVRQKKVAEE